MAEVKGYNSNSPCGSISLIQRRALQSGHEMRISITPERKKSLSDGLFAGLSDSPHSPAELTLEEKICLTYIENPALFWGQRVDNDTTAALERLSNNLQIFCKNKPLLQSPPIPYKVYGGIYSEDNLWYRVRIREIIDNEQAYVQFVDYGNSEVIRLRSIVCLSMDLLNVPQMAQLYKFDSVLAPSDATSECFRKGLDFLIEMTNGKTVLCKTKLKRKTPSKALPVELFDGNVNIGELMVKKGFLINNKNSDASPLHSGDTIRNDFELANMRETIETQKELLEKYKNMLDKQMELAVSTKFKHLKQKVRQLGLIRSKVSCETLASRDPIMSAITLIKDEKKRIHLNKMVVLSRVKDAEKQLNDVQAKIRSCSSKDLLTELTNTRNKARQDFCSEIAKFLSRVESLPLEMRSMELELRLTELSQHNGYLQSGSSESSVGIALDTLTKYEEWKKKGEEKVAEIQKQTNTLLQEFGKSMLHIRQEICSIVGESEANDEDEKSVADIDKLITRLEESIQKEISITREDVDKRGDEITVSATAVLRHLILSELDDIKFLREKLVEKYKKILEELTPWLSKEPDLTAILAIRKELKSLKSKLRHLLADRADLMEGEDPEDARRLEQVENEIENVQRKMHPYFLKEHNHLKTLADLASTYFPELQLKYQDLALATFTETNGIVKAGREIDHYPHSGSDWRLELKTEFHGKSCLIKEVSLDGCASRESFLSRVKQYSNVVHPRLRPLDAVFFDKTRRTAYVQVQCFTKIQEWIATENKTSPKDLAIVMRDILEALCVLHVAGIVHGAVTLDSILVVKRKNNLCRGILADYDCSRDMCERISKTSRSQKTLTAVEEAQNFDMSCFGQVLAKVHFPACEDVIDPVKLKEMSGDKNLIEVLDGLLRKEKQLTALQALKTPYFSECVDNVVLIDDEDIEDDVNDDGSDVGSLADKTLPLLDQDINEVNGRTSPNHVLVSNGHAEIQATGQIENSKAEEIRETVDESHEEPEVFCVDLAFPTEENKVGSGDSDNTEDSGPPPLDDL